MLTRVLRTVRLDTIDRRSQVGVALRRVQEDLTVQLGGPPEVTAAQALLIACQRALDDGRIAF
jgi:hypothetical protein